MNEVSNLFVCLMGMGTTFVGLICIIFLTLLMGKVMQKLEKPEPPKAAPVPAAPTVPTDGLTPEVKIARHLKGLGGRKNSYRVPR